MQQAKSSGRNVLRFFEPRMQAAVNARATMEVALREAINARQFALHYQIQVAADGSVVGAEALLRWPDPRRGMVSPAEFIPLAEATGLILPIGRWVLMRACDESARWAGDPVRSSWSMAVNVSAHQFHQSDFVHEVRLALQHSGADARQLKLELTEGMLVRNVEDVIAKLNALRAIGVGFSLDDFGTGYSSLAYLKRLPLCQLKIDQAFVRDILIDANDAAIAKMIVSLADSMGLTVIAEGVETEAQRDFLMSLGCRHFQGYWFGRPVPPEELKAPGPATRLT